MCEASRFTRTSGEEGLWAAFTAAPIPDNDENVIGAGQFLEDHTDNQTATKQFEPMKKDPEQNGIHCCSSMVLS